MGQPNPIAIAQGSLWTCPRVNGVVPLDRRLLWEIDRGDIVFHHYRSQLRAVSLAVTPCRSAHRPAGYPRKYDGETDDGWLVTVEPIETTLAIHYSRVAEIVRVGAPGPLDKNGEPQQKYLSRIAFDDGLRLLTEAGFEDGTEDVGAAPTPVLVSDAPVSAMQRLEQNALRAFLLDGRDDGDCGICARTFLRQLLVATHIKPRALCTDTERWNFLAVAMLACALGCDALFERGNITVDDSGTLTSGRSPSHPALAEAVHAYLGRKCPAYNDVRAAAFRVHHAITLNENTRTAPS